ncbi:hypothetical protein D9M69_511960 [compost metagenome]
MGAHHRMLGIRVHGLERQALLHGHGGAEARLDAVAGAQALDALLHVGRQLLVGQDHVRPHGVAAHRRALHAAQHATHGRGLAPGGVGVPGVFVAVVGLVRVLVDAYQAGVVRVAAGHRVVLQLAETAGEGHVLGAADVLVAQEQHLVLQQQRLDLGEQAVVAGGVAQVHAADFGADGAGQLFDFHAQRPQMTKIDEPVVLRDSRSRWACTASSSA